MSFLLFKLILVFFYLFLIGLIGIYINKKNLILILISIELIFLSINLNFIFFAFFIDDITGNIISILILTIAASESSIGLAIFVIYYRVFFNLSLAIIKVR